MPEFISLDCPACGARLKVARGRDRFMCDYCSRVFMVDRAGGVMPQVAAPDGMAAASPIPSASELLMGHVESEVTALEGRLAAVGHPESILGIALSATRRLFNLALLTGLFLYIGLAPNVPVLLGGLDLGEWRKAIAFLAILPVLGLGSWIKENGTRVRTVVQNTKQRKLILEQLSGKRMELQQQRESYLSSQSRGIFEEQSAGLLLSKLTQEISSIEKQVMDLGATPSKASVLAIAGLSFAAQSVIAGYLLYTASVRHLPFRQLPLIGYYSLPVYVWPILAVVGVAIALSAFKALEDGARKLQESHYGLSERQRLDQQLAPLRSQLDRCRRLMG